MAIFVRSKELKLRSEWREFGLDNTGANIVVSPLGLPLMNESFCLKHAHAGARFVWYQSDIPLFLEKEGERGLLNHLFQMQTLGLVPSQCVLLIKVEETKDLSRKIFTDFAMSWQDHGGIVLYAIDDLKTFLHGLDEYTVKNPVKLAKNGAGVLLSLPGVIHTMATSLSETHGLLATMLMLLDPEYSATESFGFPEKYIDRIRELFELEEGEAFPMYKRAK